MQVTWAVRVQFSRPGGPTAALCDGRYLPPPLLKTLETMAACLALFTQTPRGGHGARPASGCLSEGASLPTLPSGEEFGERLWGRRGL